MQWLAEICVKRPVFATMLVLSLVVVGAFQNDQPPMPGLVTTLPH